MPTRFYYAPIDPRYDDIGAGVGEGLASGVSSFLDERDRRRERQRRDERDAMERELHEIGMYESGYRRGQAPTEEATRFRPQEREQPDWGGLFARGAERIDVRTGELRDPSEPPNELNDALTQRVRDEAATRRGSAGELPEPGRVGMSLFSDEPVTFETRPAAELKERRTQPGFEQVTEGLYRDTGFLERERDRIAGVEAGDDGLDEIAAALEELYPDMSPEEARAHATLMGRGSGIYGDAMELGPEDDPEFETPVRGSPEYMQMLEDEAAARRRGAPPASAAERGPMTFPQAMDFLEEQYAIRDRLGDVVGYYLSPMEMRELAISMSSPGGESVELPSPTELYEQMQGGLPEGAIEERQGGGGIGGFFRNLFGGRGRGEPARPQFVDTTTTAPDTGTERPAELDPRVIQEGRDLVDEFSGFADDELEEVLRESGFSEQEIDEILHGR